MNEPIVNALEKLRKSVRLAAEKAEQLCESSEQLMIAVKDLSTAFDDFVDAYNKTQGNSDEWLDQ